MVYDPGAQIAISCYSDVSSLRMHHLALTCLGVLNAKKNAREGQKVLGINDGGLLYGIHSTQGTSSKYYQKTHILGSTANNRGNYLYI